MAPVRGAAAAAMAARCSAQATLGGAAPCRSGAGALRARLAPGLAACTALIGACGRARHPGRAAELFDQLRLSRLAPDA
eukprot:5926535-Pyramimonas_sp.AAC.1